jgi:hypothetical protein
MRDRAKQGGTVEVKLLLNIATCVMTLVSSPISRLASSFVNATFTHPTSDGEGSAMNSTLLLRLADLLEADATKDDGVRFTIDVWGTVSEPERPLSGSTTACGMGLAALSGAFHDTGLRYRLDYKSGIVIFMADWPTALIDMGRPMTAARCVFGLDEAQAEYLFLGGWPCDTSELIGAARERRMAQVIRQFVAEGGAATAG